ncbi:coiled-coil domain containing 173 [Nesidiocoris tenuis]|uniref:Coiled-coil domain containing 173 n=1 Tax=Nesidiocoris tenuis TaxID=355587 RepID=A0ABN7AQP5_9HEMI|nr:coiled-coil domain containing 173 [Nesidiocoris tenuis]
MPRFLSSKPNPNDGKRPVKTVIYTRREWDTILGHLTEREKEVQQAEALAKERDERLQQSKQMAATWDNTLVNLRRKRIALRQEKLENASKARHERYLYFKAEDEKRKEIIRAKAREIFFEMRDSTKTLRSAEKLSEVLRENEKQAEFNKKLKQKEKEEVMIEAEKIWADAEEWKREQEALKGEHSKIREERKQKAIEELEKYRKEKEEKLRAQKEEEIKCLSEMKKEIQQVAENEELEVYRRLKYRADYLREVMENREMTQRKRLAALEEEKEEDLAIRIVNEGKAKLAQMRKEKEREIFLESIKKRERVASLVAAEAKNKKDLEDSILKKAAAEKEKLFKREEEKRKEHAEKLRQERIETHQKYLEEEKRKKMAELELMKWAVLQRFKNIETTASVRETVEKIRHQRYVECRERNAKLIEEHNAKVAKEKQADLDAVRRAAAIWALHDKEFLDIAVKVREECIAAGRPSYPLDVAIADFKKRNGLLKECRGVGFIEAMPIVPGYREMAEKLKKMDASKPSNEKPGGKSVQKS